MPSSNPTVDRSVACPSCGKPSTQKYIPEKLYYVSKYDDDGHTIEYNWYQKEFELCQPHYFDVFYCPHCFYCDFKEDYINGGTSYGKQHGTLKRIQQIISVKKRQQNQAYLLLGSGIDTEHLTFNMVLNIHLLAIYIHELPEKDIQNYEKLAFLYQKTAWLYRENRNVTFHQITDSTYTEFANIFSEYYTMHKKFISKFNYYKYHIKQTINTSDLEENYKDDYLNSLYKLENIYMESTNVNAEIMNLQEFGIGNFKIENEEICQQEIFKFNKTMKEFIEEVTLHWSYMPVAETECLEHSCDYFVLDSNNNKKSQTFLTRKTSIKHIIPMCLRLGRYEKGAELIEHFLVYLKDFVVLGKQRLARLKKYNSQEEMDEVISQLHSANLDEKEYTIKYKEIKKLQNKRDLNIANTIVKSYPNISNTELIKHFKTAGISDSTTKKFMAYLENNRKMVEMNKPK